MARRVTKISAEIGSVHIAQAARPPSKPSGLIGLGGEHSLHVPRSRPPLLAPEPVDVSRAIGRQPTEWEAYLIIEARQQARARELEVLKGIR